MGEGEEKVKGKEGERWREGFGPPKNFGVAPPMSVHSVRWSRSSNATVQAEFCSNKNIIASIYRTCNSTQGMHGTCSTKNKKFTRRSQQGT